ncbi:hypothetical protein BU24DRAFT_420004 [Aaosphaeria arxii CBS 175.79]|uniref:Uncharacterized protein n=1 Tax=Aaosphaeria arxii CBS 175.79 TaxID=1450172 RepID=A0A6A5XVJ4_9PLEO|nr:uncharacterized protein BU24DRAFT_420004 [Aaosphaeria arxii CBS 175.79]KAF2016966.1 hypothetical protein BU24DRAFT_420004 [Aaosphaeria arxii CBS 175.79]
MPYVIHAPGVEVPYILDDEDDRYLTYFRNWSWPVSDHHEAREPIVAELIAQGKKKHRRPLRDVWRAELVRRYREESKRVERDRKQRKREEKEKNKASTMQEFKEKCKKLVTFAEKEEVKEDKPGYRNGIYVNWMVDMQSVWVPETERELEASLESKAW